MRKLSSLVLLGALLISTSILQGCDGVTDASSEDEGIQQMSPVKTPVSPDNNKFRHPDLIDLAKQTSEFASKDGDTTWTNLIVGFNEYEADGITKRLLSKYGITKRLLNRYSDSIKPKTSFEEPYPGITIQVDSDSLDSFLDYIKGDEDILWVEPDISLDGPTLTSQDTEASRQFIPWGIKYMGADLAISHAGNEQVHVFVFDSGISSGDLNVVESLDFTKVYRNNPDKNPKADSVAFWNDTLDDDYFRVSSTKAADRSGHGTHVAGIIGAVDDQDGVVGVASNVALHNLKVLGNDGRTDITTVLAAIDYVTKTKRANPDLPMIANLSLGAEIGTTAYNALDEAILRSIEAGVVYVVAAGNSGQDASTYSPAHVREALTVGSFDESSTYSAFSNYGDVVDLIAPGEAIVSLSKGDKKFFSIQYGTSQAAPHVAGAAALYLTRFPQASPYQVARALVDEALPTITGAPAGTTNKSVYVGEILTLPSAFDEVAPVEAESHLESTTVSDQKGKRRDRRK